MSYSSTAKRVYGERCELCGWGKATCDVHHLDYNEHNAIEREMRQAWDSGDMETFDQLQYACFQIGYGLFDTDRRQLPKNDNSINLAVLCPNCHRELHHYDLGIKILTSLPPRVRLSNEMIKTLEVMKWGLSTIR